MKYFLTFVIFIACSCTEIRLPESDDTPPSVSLNSVYDMRNIYGGIGFDRWEVRNDRVTTFPFMHRNFSNVFWNKVKDIESGARTARIRGNIHFLCFDKNGLAISREVFALPSSLNTESPFVEVGDLVLESKIAITYFSIDELDCVCRERDSSLTAGAIRAEIWIDGFNYYNGWSNKFYGELNFESE